MIQDRKKFLLLALFLLLGACHKKPPKVIGPTTTAPKPAARLEFGERDFEAGQYAEAVQSYEAYLRENPDALDRDTAVFKLALAFALAGPPVQDFSKVQDQLQILVTQYPKSRYKPEAQYILSLHEDIEKLRLDVRSRDEKNRIKDGTIRDKDELLKEKDDRIRERDDKIRKLTQELERLKKIDMDRRPSRPPE